MIEQGSQNQEEPIDNHNPTPESKPKPPKTYNAEQRRLVHLFFKSIEPYEMQGYKARNVEVPTDLDERFFSAFECYNESFTQFLDKLGYFEKLEIYPYLLEILPKKINGLGGNEIAEWTRKSYKAYYHYFRNEFKQLREDSKFHLSWDKHNKYFLPLIVDALCDTKIINVPNRIAMDAFQFIFPKEKLKQGNVDSAYRSAFIAEDPKVFINGLDALLDDIRSNLIDKQVERRKLLKPKKTKK